MPYISKDDRTGLKTRRPKTAGELNYLVTMMCDQFIQDAGLNYNNLNSVIGALECAKLEMYRRVASPYEDKKIAENGDVYVTPTK